MSEQMYSNIPQQPFCGSSVYAHRVSRAHREAGSMTASSASAKEPPMLQSMAGSATEQSDAVMDSIETDSTRPAYAKNLGTLPHVSQLQWEIHVEFNNGMWWAMPHDLSDPILNEWMKGAQQVSFVWDWGKTRKGSYRPDGAETSHNRYIIDFDSMQQRNIDNDRTRTVKVVAVLR